MHCHHKIPKSLKGTDEYSNLIFIIKDIHILIHASKTKTINKYVSKLDLNETQLKKINKLRFMANLKPI